MDGDLRFERTLSLSDIENTSPTKLDNDDKNIQDYRLIVIALYNQTKITSAAP
jgi:hypothetical protein